MLHQRKSVFIHVTLTKRSRERFRISTHKAPQLTFPEGRQPGMRGGIAGCATFLVTGYRNRPVQTSRSEFTTFNHGVLRRMFSANCSSVPAPKRSPHLRRIFVLAFAHYEQNSLNRLDVLRQNRNGFFGP